MPAGSARCTLGAGARQLAAVLLPGGSCTAVLLAASWTRTAVLQGAVLQGVLLPCVLLGARQLYRCRRRRRRRPRGTATHQPPTLNRDVSLLGEMGTPWEMVQKAVVVPCTRGGGRCHQTQPAAARPPARARAARAQQAEVQAVQPATHLLGHYGPAKSQPGVHPGEEGGGDGVGDGAHHGGGGLGVRHMQGVAGAVGGASQVVAPAPLHSTVSEGAPVWQEGGVCQGADVGEGPAWGAVPIPGGLEGGHRQLARRRHHRRVGGVGLHEAQLGEGQGPATEGPSGSSGANQGGQILQRGRAGGGREGGACELGRAGGGGARYQLVQACLPRAASTSSTPPACPNHHCHPHSPSSCQWSPAWSPQSWPPAARRPSTRRAHGAPRWWLS